MAKGFFSPKLTLHVGDGFEFMRQNQDAFDVIITDSSDPVGKRRTCIITSLFDSCHRRQVLFWVVFFCVAGPAESLFKESYYQLMKAALRNGGILCSQGNFIFHHSFVLQVGERLIGNFSKVLTWVEVITVLLNNNVHSLFKSTKKRSILMAFINSSGAVIFLFI